MTAKLFILSYIQKRTFIALDLVKEQCKILGDFILGNRRPIAILFSV